MSFGEVQAADAVVSFFHGSFVPQSVIVGDSVSFVVQGMAVSRVDELVAIELAVGAKRHVYPFQGFPAQGGLFRGGREISAEERFFSGFALPWIGQCGKAGRVPVRLRFKVRVGRRVRWSEPVEIGHLDVRPKRPRHSAGQPPAVAIAMATFNPEPERFREQLASIRNQSLSDWSLVISDESTEEQSRDAIRNAVGDDPRITLSHNRRVGFVGNFERALRALDRRATFFALCDQDDRWNPEKLDVLVRAIGRRECSLVYGGMRIVDEAGVVLEPSFFAWRRRHDHTPKDLIAANTVSGAAALGRMEVLRKALPIPRCEGLFHDMWIAIVAASMDGVVHVPRILQDYVQHGGNVLGQSGSQDRFTADTFARQASAMREATRFIRRHGLRGEQVMSVASEFGGHLSGVAAAAVQRQLLTVSLNALTAPPATGDLADAFSVEGLAAYCRSVRASGFGDQRRAFLNIPQWLEAGTGLLAVLSAERARAAMPPRTRSRSKTGM